MADSLLDSQRTRGTNRKMNNLCVLIRVIFLVSFFLATLPAYAQTQIDQKAPGFITSTLDGKRIVLKEYWEKQGKRVIVLSFFATWCQPCKDDLKYLQKMQDQYATHGLQILAVLTKDSSGQDVVKRFLDKPGVSLSVLADEYEIIGKRYGLIGLPSNFLIDREGILRAKYLGYSEEVKRDFEKRLKELLAIP